MDYTVNLSSRDTSTRGHVGMFSQNGVLPAPMAERSEAQSCSLADDCSSIIVS